MKTEEADIPEKAASPCAACGHDDGNGWAVWDQPMCNGCKNAWDKEAPADEAWDAKCPEDKARYAAKKTWTATWTAKRRTKARAA